MRLLVVAAIYLFSKRSEKSWQVLTQMRHLKSPQQRQSNRTHRCKRRQQLFLKTSPRSQHQHHLRLPAARESADKKTSSVALERPGTRKKHNSNPTLIATNRLKGLGTGSREASGAYFSLVLQLRV